MCATRDTIFAHARDARIRLRPTCACGARGTHHPPSPFTHARGAFDGERTRPRMALGEAPNLAPCARTVQLFRPIFQYHTYRVSNQSFRWSLRWPCGVRAERPRRHYSFVPSSQYSVACCPVSWDLGHVGKIGSLDLPQENVVYTSYEFLLELRPRNRARGGAHEPINGKNVPIFNKYSNP